MIRERFLLFIVLFPVLLPLLMVLLKFTLFKVSAVKRNPKSAEDIIQEMNMRKDVNRNLRKAYIQEHINKLDKEMEKTRSKYIK